MSSSSPGQKLRILSVDDDTYYLRLLRIALTVDGHNVESVADGFFAYELLAAAPRNYDVVITDQCMPEMTGLEFLERLKRLPYHGKIYALSGTLTLELIEQYRVLGADGVFDKTRQLSELSETLHQLALVTGTTHSAQPFARERPESSDGRLLASATSRD